MALPLSLVVLADTFCVIQIVGGAIILDNCSKAKPNVHFFECSFTAKLISRITSPATPTEGGRRKTGSGKEKGGFSSGSRNGKEHDGHC
jgi:hypothetical protein